MTTPAPYSALSFPQWKEVASIAIAHGDSEDTFLAKVHPDNHSNARKAYRVTNAAAFFRCTPEQLRAQCNQLEPETMPTTTQSLFTPGEPVTLLVPPHVYTMMSGATQIEIAHPRYRITYTDGTTEEATCENISDENRKDWFFLVATIQETARQ